MHQDAAQQGKRETERDEADLVMHAIRIKAGLVSVHLVVWNFNHDDMTPVGDESRGEDLRTEKDHLTPPVSK